MLKSLFSNTTSQIELSSILICTLVSLVLGMVIAYTHKKTSKYSKNFLVTLSILPALVQTVMIMVNGNLGTSVAILGAFGLVRFRSIPGTSKEILSVFFAMAIGLATGMGQIFYAIIFTIILSIVIFLLHYIKIFDVDEKERVLRIVIPEDLDYTTVFQKTFDKYLKDVKLEQVKTVNMGSLFDLSYRVVLNKNVNEKKFLDEIRMKNGNLKVILSHPVEGTEI